MHSVPLWRQRRCVFSHANGHKGGDRLSQASCICCRNSTMIVAALERVSSHFIMSHTCSNGERYGDRAGQGCWCNQEEHVASQQPYVGTVYFTLKKHQMWPRVLTDSPTHHVAWGGACVSLAKALLGRRSSSDLRRTSVRPSLAYRYNLLSSLKTTERHSTFHSTLSWHQSSRA